MADCAISISVFTPFVNRYKTYICDIEIEIVVKKFLSVLKYLLFLAIGLAVFYYIYKDFELQALASQISSIRWRWIALSLAFGVMSHICRALRWDMLIQSAGYSAGRFRTFCSVMAMYFTNLIIPRGGEIVRCTALARTDSVPFAVLLGTVVVERTVDTLLMIVIAAVMVFFQLDFLKTFFEAPGHEAMLDKVAFLFSPWFWIAGAVAGIGVIVLLWKLRHRIAQIKLFQPIIGLIMKFWDGLKSIARLEHPWIFVGQSVFIYLAYFLMLYVTFFSFAPTAGLSMGAALTAFIMGGLAMLAPVQGGIGPWHFMVFETLALYGIPVADGKIFALISHSTTNGFCLIVGAICLVYLTLVGKKKNTGNNGIKN